MKKVDRGDYLYVRNGTYYFRRAVPPDATTAFGKGEVVTSLGTRDISEARHRLTAELRKFEKTLSEVRGSVPPIERLAKATGVPSMEDLDTGVRAWLKARNERSSARLAVLREEEETGTIDALRGERTILESATRPTGIVPPINTDWIASHLIDENGWEIEDGSPLHRRLKRLILRGQIEANERARQEVLVEPIRVVDERFAPQAYAADKDRNLSGRPLSLQWLFDGYIAEANPKPRTVKAYRLQFEAFRKFIAHDNAREVSEDDLVRWKTHLLDKRTRKGTSLSKRTIRDKYLVIVKAVFRWAKRNKHLAFNPAEALTITKARRQHLRESDLTDDEAQMILSAALQKPSARLSPSMARARRWVPWLCAYTGARVNEITQLRAQDVTKIGGIWAIRITPEAGTVKDDKARIVPLHSHLIEQGFVDIAHECEGPLFYDPARHRGGSEGNPQAKKVGERLAKWVRDIGVVDPDVQPNHGWRHRFITEARRSRMPEEVRRAITGHSRADTDFRYGGKPVDVMSAEIEKLPRYEVRCDPVFGHEPPSSDF